MLGRHLPGAVLESPGWVGENRPERAGGIGDGQERSIGEVVHGSAVETNRRVRWIVDFQRYGWPVDWFAGKTAVVTGAAHGIGRGIAEQLADLGARVVAVDRDEAALTEAFGAAGPIVPCPGDMAADATADLHRAIAERASAPVDYLVNNVGFDTPHAFLELDEDRFDHVFAANLRGPWFLTRAIAQDMIERDAGGAMLLHLLPARPHRAPTPALQREQGSGGDARA